jgi:hypothetical protein
MPLVQLEAQDTRPRYRITAEFAFRKRVIGATELVKIPARSIPPNCELVFDIHGAAPPPPCSNHETGRVRVAPQMPCLEVQPFVGSSMAPRFGLSFFWEQHYYPRVRLRQDHSIIIGDAQP